MKPRITIAVGKDQVLQIFLNEAGRDILVKELVGLSKDNDHFHLQPEEEPYEVPLQVRAYSNGDRVIEYGKVLLRPDDWDAEHFPHVLW